MGFGLRFKEKVKQVGKKSAQPDKHGFVATTYERVQLTYDEAVKFAESLKVIRKRISESNIARTKMLRDVEVTLTGSLPCIHEIDPISGEHNTSEAAPEGAANYVHTGTLTRLSEEQDAKIQTQVFNPVDKWISEVDLFKGKMKILENLRLELDGSRRHHVQLENKIAKAESKNTEANVKDTTHIQSKDASVAGKRTAFEQYEAQLYEELVSLIGETGVLHTALDSLLKLEIDTYKRALDPISSTTARLEQLSTSSAGSPAAISTPGSSLAGAPVGHATSYGAQTGSGQYGAQPGAQYGAQSGSGQYGAQSGSGQYGAQSGSGQYGASAPQSASQYGAQSEGGLPNAPTHSAGQSGPHVAVAHEKPYAS